MKEILIEGEDLNKQVGNIWIGIDGGFFLWPLHGGTFLKGTRCQKLYMNIEHSSNRT